MKENPLTAAVWVKDRAVDIASDLADGYRKSNRYFRMRLVVIASWVLLSLLTLWLAARSSEPSTNALGAEVQISESLLGTQISIENTSGRMWTDVRLTLDGGWRWRTPTMREGHTEVVAASRFEKDGAFAPSDLKPRTLTIECDQGKVMAPLSGRPQ
jgi:hypothetical protein